MKHLLDDYQRHHLDPPDQATLRLWLWDRLSAELHGITYPVWSRQVISDSIALRMSASAAQFCLDHYRPDFLENAAKGGRKSRPPVKFFEYQLDSLPRDVTKVREQAAVLGCSEATVKRLRKSQRDRDAEQREWTRAMGIE